MNGAIKGLIFGVPLSLVMWGLIGIGLVAL